MRIRRLAYHLHRYNKPNGKLQSTVHLPILVYSQYYKHSLITTISNSLPLSKVIMK